VRTIQLGLEAVQGLRRETIRALLAVRRMAGPFRDLRDLLERVAVSRAEITTLIQVGALDRLAGGCTRPELLWQARLWLPAADRRRAGMWSPPPDSDKD
jgi:error-prone DNA polymerase